MRHIVVEGLDRVGKSSLIVKLAEALSAPVHKMRVPRSLSQSMEFYCDHFAQLRDDPTSTIWDRGHISELVYAPLYRPAETSIQWHNVLKLLPAYVPDVAVVYVYPGDTGLMKKDERPDANKLREITGFTRELAACYWPVYRVCSHETTDGDDWRWRSKDDMVAEILANVSLESYADTRP